MRLWKIEKRRRNNFRVLPVLWWANKYFHFTNVTLFPHHHTLPPLLILNHQTLFATNGLSIGLCSHHQILGNVYVYNYSVHKTMWVLAIWLLGPLTSQRVKKKRGTLSLSLIKINQGMKNKTSCVWHCIVQCTGLR